MNGAALCKGHHGPGHIPVHHRPPGWLIAEVVRQGLKDPRQLQQAFAVDGCGQAVEDLQKIPGVQVVDIGLPAVGDHDVIDKFLHRPNPVEIGGNGGALSSLFPVAAPAQVPVKGLQLLAGVVVQQLQNPPDGGGLKVALPKVRGGVVTDPVPQGVAQSLAPLTQLQQPLHVQQADPHLVVKPLVPLDIVEVTPLRGTIEISIPFEQ